jgi:hypothetical protein
MPDEGHARVQADGSILLNPDGSVQIATEECPVCCDGPEPCWVKFTICECSIPTGGPPEIWIRCSELTEAIQFVVILVQLLSPPFGNEQPPPPPGEESDPDVPTRPACYARTPETVTELPPGAQVPSMFNEIPNCETCCQTRRIYTPCENSLPAPDICLGNYPDGVFDVITTMGKCYRKGPIVPTCPPGMPSPTVFAEVPSCDYCDVVCPTAQQAANCPSQTFSISVGEGKQGCDDLSNGGCHNYGPDCCWTLIPAHSVVVTRVGTQWIGTASVTNCRIQCSTGEDFPSDDVLHTIVILCNGPANVWIADSSLYCAYAAPLTGLCPPGGGYTPWQMDFVNGGDTRSCPRPDCDWPVSL